MEIDTLVRYYQDSRINNTAIKSYIKDGIIGLKTVLDSKLEYEVTSDALQRGSAVDIFLTSGKEAFDNAYYVADLPNISDKPKLIIEQLLDTIVVDPARKATFEGVIDVAFSIAKEFGYRGNIKNDITYKDWLIRDCKPYYDARIAAGTRTVISVEDKMFIDKTILKFQTAFPYIFNNVNPDIDVYFQLPVYGTLENVECKALLDIVVVNKNRKAVYIFDLKTTDRLIQFIYVFNKLLYNVQATVYTKLAKQLFKDYTVHNLAFIAAGLNDNLPAQTFNCTDIIIDATYNGSEHYKFMSVKEALYNIKVHLDTNNFDLDLKYLPFRNSSKTSIVLDTKLNNFNYDFEVAKTE